MQKPPTATTIRPIEDFIDRQGTFCIDINFATSYEDEIVDGNFVGDEGNCQTGQPPLLFVPPIANFNGASDPEQLRLASIDYSGLADHWAGGAFGTTFSGKVIERPLADGRAHVTVLLRTQNALTWVVDDPDQTFDFNGQLLFGNRAPEVVSGAEPALGSASINLEFINTEPGADLPDVLQVLFFPEPEQEVLRFNVNNKANGPLTWLFGVPEGTPGLNIGTQVGLLGNPNCGNVDSPSALVDCFPVERINLREVGR
jgi:hypothetical protein